MNPSGRLTQFSRCCFQSCYWSTGAVLVKPEQPVGGQDVAVRSSLPQHIGTGSRVNCPNESGCSSTNMSPMPSRTERKGFSIITVTVHSKTRTLTCVSLSSADRGLLDFSAANLVGILLLIVQSNNMVYDPYSSPRYYFPSME